MILHKGDRLLARVEPTRTWIWVVKPAGSPLRFTVEILHGTCDTVSVSVIVTAVAEVIADCMFTVPISILFADGEEMFTARPAQGILKMRVRKGFNRKEVEKVLARGGKLSFGEALRCKIRYLSDGMVFGSRDYVTNVFIGYRDQFSEKRTSGARSIRGVGWKRASGRLYSMRELRPFS